MSVTSEMIRWTREALEHLYDPAFLEDHARSPVGVRRFNGGQLLRERLIACMTSLAPVTSVSRAAPARRLHDVLQLRYLRGLTQAEAAEEANLSLRQLRREQDHGIEAVASLLFADDAADSVAAPAPQAHLVGQTPRVASLVEVARIALTVVEPLFRQRDVRLALHLPESLPHVAADPTALRQMLIMALTWVAHGSTGSLAHLTTTEQAQAVELTLTSAAPVQADEEWQAVQRLARLCDATTHLDDQRLQLDIVLPISRRLRVLMIDDSLDVIALTRRQLAVDERFELIAINTVNDGLAAVFDARPDCILLDVMMPGRDGWEVLSALKSHPATATIPVIISSAATSHALGRSLGADAVLLRPCTSQALITLLSALTAPRPATQEQPPASAPR